MVNVDLKRWFKKGFSLAILLVLASMVSNAEVQVPDRVLIGLYYDNTALSQFDLRADHGFSMGQYVGNQYVEISNLSKYNVLNVSSDVSYHVQIGKAYGDQSSFDAFYKEMNNQENQVFPGYDHGWRLYYGSYSSIQEANAAQSYLAQKLGNIETFIKEPDSKAVALKNSGRVVYIYNPSDGEYIIKDLSFDGSDEIIRINEKAYRDGIVVKKHTSNLLTAINSLPMNQYLYGVLPKEMSKDWPIEALKAQAVAARNYAMMSMNKHLNSGFSLCATVDCQVYGGYSVEGPISSRAVDETTGMVLYYNNQIVQTFYHSSSGGQTENSENIWSNPVPYLKGVYDPFSASSPNSNWSVSISKDTIKNALESYGYSVGSIQNVRILETSENGRVLKLEIMGTTGTVVLNKEETRKVLGYSTIKSMWFTFGSEPRVSLMTSRGQSNPGQSRISVFNGSAASNLDISTMSVYNGTSFTTLQSKPVQNSDTIEFNGHGYGHGLGMSQWGAKEMADQGFNFEDILTHYYKDTYLIKTE